MPFTQVGNVCGNFKNMQDPKCIHALLHVLRSVIQVSGDKIIMW